MSVSPLPTDTRITSNDVLNRTWQAFFSSVYFWLKPIGSFGTTANRPTNVGSIPLYTGQTYFDTTLGKPIWLKSLNPTVWVDATGTSV